MNKPVEEQKLKLLQQSLRVLGYTSFNICTLDAILSVYEVVNLKLDGTELRDLLIIEHDINIKYQEKKEVKSNK